METLSEEVAQAIGTIAYWRRRCEDAEAVLSALAALAAQTQIVILAARRTVAGPDVTNYTALAAALDTYDALRKEQAHAQRDSGAA